MNLNVTIPSSSTIHLFGTRGGDVWKMK
jgi:hypothetical protein